MWFVALQAAGDKSMLLAMALGTLDFRMLARVRLEFLSNLCVAVAADLCKFGSHRHLCLWSVWVRVACCATGELFTVDVAVTGLAFRHDLCPVLFVRIVRMIFRMALHTIDLVLPALILYLRKDRVVTPGAFLRG